MNQHKTEDGVNNSETRLLEPGMEHSNIDPVSVTESTEADQVSNDPVFFPVSEGKLITLYLLSFGLYGVYWFYKNWKLQQSSIDKKIYPLWRAIFSIFFTHSLFNRIDQQTAQLDKKHKFNANLLATIFVAAVVASNILDRLFAHNGMVVSMSSNMAVILSFALFFLSAYPLVKVQATVNRINNDMLGYLNHRYSLWNYILIALGAVLWLLIGFGLLIESMGLALPE